MRRKAYIVGKNDIPKDFIIAEKNYIEFTVIPIVVAIIGSVFTIGFYESLDFDISIGVAALMELIGVLMCIIVFSLIMTLDKFLINKKINLEENKAVFIKRRMEKEVSMKVISFIIFVFLLLWIIFFVFSLAFVIAPNLFKFIASILFYFMILYCGITFGVVSIENYEEESI